MMNSNNRDKNRNSDRYPFDEQGHEFNNLLRAIEEIMKKAFEETTRGNLKPGKSYVRGFNLHIDSEGKPRIEEFGNYPKNVLEGKGRISEEREPLADVFENNNHVAITIEIPGVERKDIDLKAWDRTLEIHVSHPKRKYQKTIELPCDVKPETTKATYKNGILDVILRKNNKDKDGYKIDIN